MKKLNWNNIFMIVAIVAIFSYIFFEVYSVTHIELKTEKAVLSTTYQKIDTQALAVRDEKTLAAPSGVVCVPAVNDGDKVKVGGNVALNFASAEEATGYSKYSELQKQLQYYQRLQSSALSQTASIETINGELKNELNAYIRAMNRGDTDTLEQNANRINDSLIRRRTLIGEEVDLMQIISDLTKEAEQYASYTPGSFVKAEKSGVFSSYTDGYETAIPYEEATEVTAEKLENTIKAIAKGADAKEESTLGKLMTSYVWYFECVLDAEEVKNLSDGQKVELALKSREDVILNAEVISGAEPADGTEKTVLVLKCNNVDAQLATLRLEDIEIRIKAYEGFKIPAAALHVKDGKKGVYALISSQVNFRETETIYSDEDWVIVKYEPDNPKGIRLHDKIIIQGKELEDGKVYT